MSEVSRQVNRLWEKVPGGSHPAWKSISRSESVEQKVRYCYELVSSVLWRLGICDSLGPLPQDTIMEYRAAAVAADQPTGWEAWKGERVHTAVERGDRDLAIRFTFADEYPEAAIYAIQSTLFGDVTFRLCGAWDEVRTNPIREKLNQVPRGSSSFLLSSRRKIERSLRQIAGGRDLGSVRRQELLASDHGNLAVVVALRDNYGHGESKRGKDDPLRVLREHLFDLLTPSDIVAASLRVCEELLTLLTLLPLTTMKTTWRRKGAWPSSYDDVEAVREIACQVKDEIVEMDWQLDREELRRLRRAVFQWGRHVVKQFKRFDYEVVQAINRAIGDPGGVYRMERPGGAEHRESAAVVEPEGDTYRFRAHGSFSVAFGYGRVADLALRPRNADDERWRALLGHDLAAKIQDAVGLLGWDLEQMRGSEFHAVVCEIYNLPSDYPLSSPP